MILTFILSWWSSGLKCNFMIIVFMSCIWLVGCWKFTSLRVCKLHLLNLKYFDICRLWSLRNLPCFYIMWRILAFLHLTCIHPNIQSDKFLPHRISPSIYKIKHIRVKVCSIMHLICSTIYTVLNICKLLVWIWIWNLKEPHSSKQRFIWWKFYFRARNSIICNGSSLW